MALGVLGGLGRPEELVRGAARALEEGGVLVVSVLDRQTNANERRGASGGRGMHAEEFQVPGAAGAPLPARAPLPAGGRGRGIVFPASGEMAGVAVESARFRPAEPLLGAGAPTTRSVVAVCSDAPLGREEGPYLLVDRDGGVFDESAERAENVWLLRQEILQMQETEAQAFLDALRNQRRQNLADLQKHYLFLIRSAAAGNAAHLRNVVPEEVVHRRNIIRHLRNVALGRGVHLIA